MKTHFTDDDLVKYVKENGHLKRSLEPRDCTRILTAVLIKTDKEGVRTMKSKSSVDSYISALKYWHEESDLHKDEGQPVIEVSKDFSRELVFFKEGGKRCNVSIFANGESIDDNCKWPISFEAYKVLAKYSMLDPGQNNALVNHAYALLCWNLIERSSTIGELLWNNIGWGGDCLLIKYEHDKTNQTGEGSFNRPVYANPFMPEICPMLALALILCCDDTDSSDEFKVFSSRSASKTFSS